MPPKTGGIFVYIRIYNIGAVAFAKAGEVLRSIIRMFYIRARQIKVYFLCLLSTRIKSRLLWHL